MRVAKLPVKQIKPNNYNPNKLDGELFESLKHGIREYGMIQPILVREADRGGVRMEGNDYIIIDGFHRWKASKEVGLLDVWCVVVESSHEEAKLKTISFNILRGQNDTELLGDLMGNLLDYFSVDEITIETGFTYNEIKDVFVMNEMDLAIFDELEKETEKAKEEIQEETTDKPEQEEKEKQMSVAGIFGSAMVQKDLADKIGLLFEEIKHFDDNPKDLMLPHAVSECKDLVRSAEIFKIIEGAK